MMKRKKYHSIFVMVWVLVLYAVIPARGQHEFDTDFTVQTLWFSDGTEIEKHIINGPPVPPAGSDMERQVVSLPVNDTAAGIKVLAVPAFKWVFGCAAVVGAMIAGYYDRSGWSDIYTGPANGGVVPLDDKIWGTWSDGYDSYPSNPLVGARKGVDGRTSRGSIEDYWIHFDNADPDPYMSGGWVQHKWGDAIGDYMKTSQYVYENDDGSTSIHNFNNSPDRFTCAEMVRRGIQDYDGTYGRKLFYEARGYSVADCYNQRTDNLTSGGFSFAQYKAEIDAGRPVMLNLTSHTVAGVGYDDAKYSIYIHDTWDNYDHIMVWGGLYAGEYSLRSVSIVNLIDPEDFLLLISHYYRNILGRDPDSPGQNYWEGEVRRMQVLVIDLKEVFRVMAGQFFNSPEYLGRHTSDSQYLIDLYQTFFNRSPDPDGFDYWVGQLNAGLPRDMILYAFLFSPEFEQYMQGLLGDTSVRAEISMVGDFYRGLLGRLPDDNGFYYWRDRFRDAQCQGAGPVRTAADAISQLFARSSEYAGRNRNNKQFVQDLYYAFLRRGADLVGFSYWIDQLDRGKLNREQVRQAFVAAPEFQGRVEQVIDEGCL